MKSLYLFDPHLITLFFLCFFFDKSHTDPRATEAALICTNSTASAPLRQIFIANFLATMDALTPLIAANRYGAVINGTGNATVYAFGECMRDLSQQDCNLCIAQCKTQILRCLPFQLLVRGGRLFYDGCYLRYDDYDFFNESFSLVDKTVCGGENFGGNLKVFNGNVMNLVMNLSLEAGKSDGFSVSSVDYANATVFGLGQCWKFIRGSSCSNCLNDAVKKIDSCPPKQEGRALNSGCYLRYSRERFYYNNTDSSSSSGNGGRSRLAIILSSVCAAVAVIVIIGTIAFFARKRVLKKKRERKQLGALIATVNKSKLNFSYEVLERATRYFDNSNKLGQGGSGSVYKGVLPDGKVVAIKRLFFNSRQWVDHFFNEVNLISNIDHKNLVKLLGCSITGPESLLVYEYVPNQSLHDYLTAEKYRPLSWEERYKIILGTAEGLAYLHEESEVRIIHRDIKLSNILLEDDFTPKIADFGLARLFPEDKTHISTAIAGTLGYMAPEYVVRGKLSEKADTYSFGVMVTEVVTGKKNNYFSQDRFSILQMVWNLYGLRNLCEAVDPILDGNFQEEEASRLLQIGLLCVQASADLRPAMSMVVKMVNGNIEIPQPTQPPFLNSTGSAEMFRAHIHSGNSKSIPNSNTQSSGNDLTQSWIEPR